MKSLRSVAALTSVLFVVGGCAGEIDAGSVHQDPEPDLATVPSSLDMVDMARMVNPLDQAAPPDLTSGTFKFADWTPPAKGLWIWHWDYIGKTAAEAAEIAADLGVGYVLIKSGQDANQWSDRYNATTVGEFTKRGIRVLAWPYITPNNIAGSIDAAVKAAQIPGTDGLVLDVEIEWEENGDHSAAAEELCKGIRKGAPDTFLGYTSWGWVGYHATKFPFTAFDTYCGDGYFAQVYFSDRGVSWDGDKGLPQALSMYEDSGLKAPLWVAISNDDVYPTMDGPTTQDLNDAFDASGARASLWEFPGKSWPEKLDQLYDLHWTNP